MCINIEIRLAEIFEKTLLKLFNNLLFKDLLGFFIMENLIIYKI